jgi:hypothetical protein
MRVEDAAGGAAVAKLGRFFGNDTNTIYEVFSRLQLQY